jgi:hypothetical protein
MGGYRVFANSLVAAREDQKSSGSETFSGLWRLQRAADAFFSSNCGARLGVDSQ